MPGSEPPPLTVEPEFCVVSRRNNSLGTRQRWTLFGILAAVSLGLALAFAAAGAWMVLPYSLLEVALLGLAFHWIEARAGDWERLTVAGDHVIVERELRGVRDRHEWNRPWVRVGRVAGRGFGDGALELRSGGEAVSFGEALPERERAAVAAELRKLIAARAIRGAWSAEDRTSSRTA